MSSWHNRQKRRAGKKVQKVAIQYIFKDGVVINDYGDGQGQKEAVDRFFATKVGYKVNHIGREE